MKIIIEKDREALYGKYDIFVDPGRDAERVHVGHGTWMYYSGHPYHSQNDTSFEFHVELQCPAGTEQPAEAEALYLAILQSRRGNVPNGYKSEVDFKVSYDGGRSWADIKAEEVPADLVVIQKVHPK